ncbi:MAG TPA: NifB/NifX family molybdenum-iron cluster-binding protein, partial [Vicinamibacterales bacterium]|nr:NifB/NifX family molybdenum-iron cluster-binding protein [Vicinamibacterales bacterium]
MAKAAFSIAGDRMAPVFDVARPLRIIDAEGGRVVGESGAEFADDVPERRALQLVALGVTELVCGAASRPMHAALAAHGIRVTPFVTGRTRDVVQAWLSGHVTRPAFAMPGCRGRRRRGGLPGRGLRGVDRPFEGAGRGGEGAGWGGGRGQGAGQGRGPRLG